MHRINNVTAKELAHSFEDLRARGFIFRGHEDANYILQPTAFRPQVKLDMLKKLGLTDHDELEWFSCKEIKSHINLWAKGAHQNPYAKATINRLMQYCLYVQSLNYTLHNYAEHNNGNISPQDNEWLRKRDATFWTSKDTFIYLFSSYFPRIIQYYDMDNNKLIRDANPFEDLTGIDETLPQHYGVATAALDWTHNPLVSVYFAVGKNTQRPGILTIYALRLHNPEQENHPIKQINVSKDVINLRAIAQEGTFTYFTKPCSFFLRNGELPSIKHYCQKSVKPIFELIEFQVERTAENISYLVNILSTNEINEHTLFPDEKTNPVIEIIGISKENHSLIT